MADIGLEVIAVVFQRIERFICDAPACSGALHEPVHRALVDPQVGHPTAVLDVTLDGFPALHNIDPQIGIGCIKGHVSDKAKAMLHVGCKVLTLVIRDASGLLSLGHLLE